MIATPANKEILREAGILGADGEHAGPGDLAIALRAKDAATANAAMVEAQRLLDQPRRAATGGGAWQPHTLRGAVQQMPDANLALISVPGDFAAAEAQEGAAARAQCDDLLRQRARARRGRSEARGARARAARDGAGLRDRHHRRRAAGLCQLGAARRCRHHRRIGHRHPGGVVPACERGTRHLACDRHGRARSLCGGRRHHHADGDRSAGPRSRNRARGADLQAAGARGGRCRVGARRPQPQAVHGVPDRRRADAGTAGQCEIREHAERGGGSCAGAGFAAISGSSAQGRRARQADPRAVLRRHVVLRGTAGAARRGAGGCVECTDPRRGAAREKPGRPHADRPRRRCVHARAAAPDDRAGPARWAAARGAGGRGRGRRSCWT